MKNSTKYNMLTLTLSITFCLSLPISAMEPMGESNESGELGSREVDLTDQQILKKQINTLKFFQKTLNTELNKELPSTQRNNILQLKKEVQKLINKAYDMYFGAIPVNTQLIEVQLIHQRTDFIDVLTKKYW